MTATIGAILPKGKTQFCDGTGTPLAGGSVAFYIPATTTPLATYQDQALTIPNSNPVILDANGEALIWGFGSYRQIVADSNGNQIWDEVIGAPNVPVFGIDSGAANAMAVSISGIAALYTGLQLIVIPANSNTGATSLILNGLGAVNVTIGSAALPAGAIAAGVAAQMIFDGANLQLLNPQLPPTTNSPGDIKAIAGPTPPTGWDLCYGKIYSRTTDAALFAAIGTTWGAGDGSTTFNGPDFRGRAIFGADAMGGAAANRLTSASLGGSGISASGFVVMGTPVTSGGVTTYSAQEVGIANPGQNYTSIPAVTVVAATGSGMVIEATILNGVVNGLTIASAGSGYPANVILQIAPPSSSTTAILGATGGSELTQTHNHTITDPEHGHVETAVQTIRAGNTGNYWNALCDGPTASSGGAGTNPGVTSTAGIATAATGITIAEYGSGTSQNLPPAAVTNICMYVG